MLAEVIAQEFQEIQTREKTQAQVSILNFFQLPFLFYMMWLMSAFSLDATENKKRTEIKDGKGNRATASSNHAQ